MSSNRGSRNHTTDGNHRKTSILQFLQLVFLLLSRIGRVEAKRIESKVTRGTVVFVHVGKGRETARFEERDPSEDLNHRFRQSIMGSDDLWNGLKRELRPRDAEEFGDNESNSGQHCRSAVLEFSLTEPWEPLRGTLATRKTIHEKGNTMGPKMALSVVPTSAKPAGSQFTDDDCELKGMGSGPSPPTYPLANSFKADDAFPDVAGAKALADPARAATVTRNLFMVADFQGKKVGY
jgi:hypothetical protein